MPGTEWQKSSFSGEPHQECVELAISHDDTHLHLRESDEPTTVLTTTPPRLVALLRLAREQLR